MLTKEEKTEYLEACNKEIELIKNHQYAGSKTGF